MALSSWLCINSSKNMLVKVVFPGGRIELHDRPIIAAEIMLRYPGCCVTHPHVFSQPWAVLTPDNVLTLGHKFYVVPFSTLRQLQRSHLNARRSPSPRRHPNSQNFGYQPIITLPDVEDDGGAHPASCWSFSGKNTTTSSSRPSRSDEDDDSGKESGEESCFMWLMPGSKSKLGDGEDDGSPTSARSNSVEDSSKTGESPRRSSFSMAWQPSLARISEDEIV